MKYQHIKPGLSSIAVLSIVILSIVFRFWKLGEIPVGLYWDEIAMYVDAKTIAQNGKDMHGNFFLQPIFISYGDYKLPVYIWFASLSFKILGASEFALRLPSALIGVVQGFLIFFYLRVLTRKSLTQLESYIVSMLGWFVFSVSPWSILFSRTGFEGFLGQFFVTASVVTLFLSIRSKKWLLLTSCCSVLAVYSYYSVRFVWPVVLGSFWLFFLYPKVTQNGDFTNLFKGWRKTISSAIPYIIVLCVFFIGLIPMTQSRLYAASQQYRLSAISLLDITPFIVESNRLQQLSNNSLFSKLFYHQRILQGKDLLNHYADHLDFNYLFLTGDSNLRHSTSNHGLFLLFCFPLLLIGLFYLFRKSRDLWLFLVSWWLISLLPASVPTDTPHALRSLNALTPVTIMMAFGALPIIRLLKTVRDKRLGFVTILVISFIVVFQVIMFAIDYFYVYPQKSAVSWQSGYKQLAEAFVQKKQGMTRAWINIADDKFYLWYLAYSQLTAQQIQSLQYQNYQIKSTDNTEFAGGYPWNQTPEPVMPYLLIMNMNQPDEKPSRQETVYDNLGKPKFLINYYEASTEAQNK